MKRALLVMWGILIPILGIGVGVFLYVNHLKSIPPKEPIPEYTELTKEELIDSTKPAIVRVVQDVRGSVRVPVFAIDLFGLEIIADEKLIEEREFAEVFLGSGFVVDPSGYVLTNSHVVSYGTIRWAIAAELAWEKIDAEIRRLEALGVDTENTSILHTDEEYYEFGEEIVRYIKDYSTFDIEKKLMVIKPNAREETLSDAILSGYSVSMKSVNDDFYDNARDFALIKINAENLPAIDLGDSDALNVGRDIAVLGFPGSAEFNANNYLESTYTDGTLNALKDSILGDFKVFQTDAKISHGSSGGPMLDRSGNVVGIITFQSSDLQRQEGDNFAFAIPINVVYESLEKYKVVDEALPELDKASSEGTYTSIFREALKYYHANRCSQALEAFSRLDDINLSFSTWEYREKYEKDCADRIAAGTSVESRYDEIITSIADSKTSIWVLGAGAVFLLFFAVIVYLLVSLQRNRLALLRLRERQGIFE